MVEYSEDYHAQATATDDTDRWTTESRGQFEVGIPQEFGGTFDGPAPENYYAIALTNCYVATFTVMADNSDFTFQEVNADGTLRLRPDDGSTVVDSFDLTVELQVESPDRKAEVLLKRTQEHCFILQSVDFPVSVEYEVISG